MKNLDILYKLFCVCGIIISGVSCNEQQRYASPQGYDLNKPVKYFMADALTEISGITFYRGKADILYAEQDEEGRVYSLDLNDPHLMYTKFDKKGDYEDIAILGEEVIVLRSDGALFVFPFNQIGKPDAANVRKWDRLLPPGEYEGMYADEETGQLYILCKHCSEEKTSKEGGGFIFKLLPNGTLKQSGQFGINVRDIETLLGKKKVQLHPSALAKNPKTNEWYILSSVNKLLVVADAGWKVKAVYPLAPSLFLQPEGIAFDNKNNLYISNEGDKATKATVLKFNYKK
ncbi:SdiA-regulated domain-containing protein [Mucilaginibacter sp. HD30]